MTPESITSQDDYDDWHFARCVDIRSIYSEAGIEFHFGQSQKWLNMMIKYLYMIGECAFDGIFQYLHVPLDNYIFDAAQKELDYANDNLQKTYEQYITNFDNYMTQINIAITNVGSMQNRLQMTQTRVENQQMTIKELKSSNEDRDISDIIIDYTAAYNAYQASLTAASKVGQQTLLDYL